MTKQLVTIVAATIVAISIFSGCSSTPSDKPPVTGKKNTSTHHPADKRPKPNTVENASIASLLRQQLESWRGTPYKLGGMSKSGIDCSGFIHVTFKDVLDIRLPRTTQSLARTGTEIQRNELNVGDLVFFKTGYLQRHVGIYVGNKHFIHASTSKGVIKSRLNSPYWKKHYWKSRRILSH